MITLSLNFDKGAKNANRGAHEQLIRDIVDTHLAFPGSEKLKMGVNIKNNGDASVSFTGPKDAIAEARRLWRENAKPAAAKVKRAALKLRQSAARATKSVKRKSAKFVAARKAAPKPKTVKKAAKRVVARAKSKVSPTRSKKRKSRRTGGPERRGPPAETFLRSTSRQPSRSVAGLSPGTDGSRPPRIQGAVAEWLKAMVC
jgi:hypothetical protein